MAKGLSSKQMKNRNDLHACQLKKTQQNTRQLEIRLVWMRKITNSILSSKKVKKSKWPKPENLTANYTFSSWHILFLQNGLFSIQGNCAGVCVCVESYWAYHCLLLCSHESYVLLAVVCAFTHRIFLKILLFKISTLIYKPHSVCIQPPGYYLIVHSDKPSSNLCWITGFCLF